MRGFAWNLKRKTTMKKMIFAALVAVLVATARAASVQDLKKAQEVGSRATFVIALVALQAASPDDVALGRLALTSAVEVEETIRSIERTELPLSAAVAPAVTAMARTMAMTEARCLGRRERVVAVAGSAAWACLAAGAAELAGDRRAAKLGLIARELTALTGAAADENQEAFSSSVRRLMRLAE